MTRDSLSDVDHPHAPPVVVGAVTPLTYYIRNELHFWFELFFGSAILTIVFQPLVFYSTSFGKIIRFL